MNKKLTGQLISIKFTDRKEPIYGFVIDYNEDWTLMKYNPVDYIIDGYIILRHKNIEGYRQKQGLNGSEKIPIDNLQTILSFLTKKFGVFQFYTKSETACYLGRLKSLDSKLLVIDFLDTDGKWNGQMKFRPNDIRTIEFKTDYINSLKLIADTAIEKR